MFKFHHIIPGSIDFGSISGFTNLCAHFYVFFLSSTLHHFLQVFVAELHRAG